MSEILDIANEMARDLFKVGAMQGIDLKILNMIYGAGRVSASRDE